MYEKVNPSHPDKMADRIAGALVDLAYSIEEDPKIAVEVLLGHNTCTIIAETSVELPTKGIDEAVCRITESNPEIYYLEVGQDPILSDNQKGAIRCGDNGVFKGCPVTPEQEKLSEMARDIYDEFLTDGKYIINGMNLTICQSCASDDEIEEYVKYKGYPLRHCFNNVKINPLGYWTGGPDVDTGATNRKLGSDMGDAVTGGGLHGKDLSKADVSVNIYAHIFAQKIKAPVFFTCSIGDEEILGRPYSEIVEIARDYIHEMGGFEKLAEWGLI